MAEIPPPVAALAEPAKPDFGHPLHLFIDTSAFERLAFAFHSPLFRAIIEKVKAGALRIVLSTVTQREVEKRMGVLIAEAREGISRAKDLKLLLGEPKDSLEDLFDWEAAAAASQTQWKKFQEEAKVILLAVGDKDGASVIDDYFKRLPPFSSKKKEEFRDAFAIAALRRCAAEKAVKIAVVSHDGDFKLACATGDPLYHFDDVAQVLQVVDAKQKELREISEGVLAFVTTHQAELEEQITKEFVDRGFFWDAQDGEDAEVAAVDDATVESMHLSVIDLSGEYAGIAGSVTLSFHVEASYPDPNSAYRDDETKTVVHMGNVHVALTARVTVPVSFSLDREVMADGQLAIDDLEVNEGRDVRFSDVEVERVREDNLGE